MEETFAERDARPRRSAGRVTAIVVFLVAAALVAYFAGRSTVGSDVVAQLVKSNKLIGKDAAGIREMLPKVEFEGGTTNSQTVCKVPGVFSDTYFQVTFKDGKVIGARTMSGPSGRDPAQE